MHPYLEQLKEELENNPPNYGYQCATSLLEMLYMWYDDGVGRNFLGKQDGRSEDPSCMRQPLFLRVSFCLLSRRYNPERPCKILPV